MTDAERDAILLEADTQPPAGGDGPWKVSGRSTLGNGRWLLRHTEGHVIAGLLTEPEARAVANCLNRVASRHAASGGGMR